VTAERHLITGANGQDGGYLVEALLAADEQVHGVCHTWEGLERFTAEHPGATGHIGDLGDAVAIVNLIADIRPTRIYNLAGNTSVARSWEYPAQTADVLGLGPVRLYEAAERLMGAGQPVRILQASSAEIFGDAAEVPQRESTPIRPVTPYGAAKAYAHQMAGIYRARGLHVSAAILYNHESPRRPASFVARKIALGVARISRGMQDELVLGNIDVLRDWGYAPDYVDAMRRIIEQRAADDYLVASGEARTVREYVAEAFAYVGISDWASKVRVDPALYRPADPQRLVGDAGKLRGIGWQPTMTFKELVAAMIEAELSRM
jgi:GDPmannose 4,6-dehydratase